MAAVSAASAAPAPAAPAAAPPPAYYDPQYKGDCPANRALYRVLQQSPARGKFLPALRPESVLFAHENRAGTNSPYDEVRMSTDRAALNKQNAMSDVLWTHATVIDPRSRAHPMGTLLATFVRPLPDELKCDLSKPDTYTSLLIPQGYCKAVPPNTNQFNLEDAVLPTSVGLRTKKRQMTKKAVPEKDENTLMNIIRFDQYGPPDVTSDGVSPGGQRAFDVMRAIHRAMVQYTVTQPLSRNSMAIIEKTARKFGFDTDNGVPLHEQVNALGLEHEKVNALVDAIMARENPFARDIHMSEEDGAGKRVFSDAIKPNSAFVTCRRQLTKAIDQKTSADQVDRIKKALAPITNFWAGPCPKDPEKAKTYKPLVSVQEYLSATGQTYNPLPIHMLELRDGVMHLRDLSIIEGMNIDISKCLVSVGMRIVGRPNPNKEGGPVQFSGNIQAQLTGIIVVKQLEENPRSFSRGSVSVTLTDEEAADAMELFEASAAKRQKTADAGDNRANQETSTPPPLDNDDEEEEDEF